MLRALIEFLFMIGLALLARAVLRSILGGVARVSSQAFNQQAPPGQAPNAQAPRPGAGGSGAQKTFTGGDLHKDPVCGTYVAEGSSLKRQIGGQTFYYCSENCREKHALAAR